MIRVKNEKNEVELVTVTIEMRSLNNSSRMYSAQGSVRVSHSKDNTSEIKPLEGRKSTQVIICLETASCNAALAAL